MDAVDLGGFRGQKPHDIFHNYMTAIASHPAFEGMPDAYYDDGRVQWEAPSNRTGGKFKDSHQKRREWWAKQAGILGISTLEDRWISRVAKSIHPTMKKPCKKCGHVMDIRYVYPSKALLARIRKLKFIEADFETSQIEDIFSLISRMHDSYGEQVLKAFAVFWKGASSLPKASAPLADWLEWIENDLVPKEPRTLSPGAMSNAPDRFDGFHSFNRCCRGEADKGRTVSNLRSYTTDRRVFEYWAAGNWIAADRLMGIIRRDFRDEPCMNGHAGPCQADHIGPISLGFNHFPRFQLLCASCNSAKNNRMYPSDVAWLVEQEGRGEQVISWHTESLWKSLKHQVLTQEHSLRLSKVLRDNRHSYMNALAKIAENGNFGFLASLLELHHADQDVEFVGLRISKHITEFDEIRYTQRDTKYSAEQKARRSRIAFRELLAYFSKINRSAYVVSDAASDASLLFTLRELDKMKHLTASLDSAIETALESDPTEADTRFRQIYLDFIDFDLKIFDAVRGSLRLHMDAVSEILASMWEHERFTRVIDLVD